VIVFRSGPALVGSRQAGFRLWRRPQARKSLHRPRGQARIAAPSISREERLGPDDDLDPVGSHLEQGGDLAPKPVQTLASAHRLIR
jgi:hypothetical protein